MTQESPFVDGYRLIDGTTLNDVVANPVWSVTSSVTATAGGTVFNSVKITDTITKVTSAVANAGVVLPQAMPGLVKIITNNSANTIIVFAEDDSTVNGIPGDIGYPIEPGYSLMFTADALNVWESLALTNTSDFQESCVNIAALRDFPMEVGKSVLVEGYYEAGDGASRLFYPSVVVPKAQFTGSIAMTVDANSGVDNVLTVSAVASGAIYVGMKITGSGLSAPMYVWQFLSGVNGGAGTYSVRDAMGNPLNISVASSPMTGTQYWDNGGTVVVPTGGDGTQAWLSEISGPVNVKWFGTKNADISLSSIFLSLAAAQAVYPFVTSLSQKIDQVAIQAAILFAQGAFNRQYAVFVPKGMYITDAAIYINNVNGVKLIGERTTSLYDGAFVNFTGSDFAFRLRNAKNPNIAVNNVTVTNGSQVISGVTSWPYLTAGMAVLINGGSWGTIQSVGVDTVTSTVPYTGATSSTATFDSTYSNGDIYRVEMSDLGIFCTNQTYAGGAVYGRYVDESKFHRVNVYGANTIYPNVTYKTQFAFYLEGFVLSSMFQCSLYYVRNAIFNSRVCLGTSISECNLFALESGIYFGDGIYGLNIVRNYFELFENGIILANNSYFNSIDCWQMNVTGNSFKRSYATGNSRSLNIQNVDNTKLLRIKLNYENNYHDMFNAGGPAPANVDYAVQIYMDAANVNSGLIAHFANNIFTYVNGAGVVVNDSGLRPEITDEGNVSTTGWNNTYVKNFAFVQSSMAALASRYSQHRQNVGVTAPNDLLENVLTTFVIPPNLLKTNGAFVVKANFSLTNNANNKTLRFRFGSVTGIVMSSVNAVSSALATMEAEASNRDVSNSQIVRGTNLLSSGSISMVSSTAAVDTTVPVVVVVTAQKANAADSIVLENLQVDVLAS